VKEQVKFFEVQKGEDGGYVIREPWSNGRLWIAKTFDELLKWITRNVYRRDT
jgi:hypothetical protein